MNKYCSALTALSEANKQSNDGNLTTSRLQFEGVNSDLRDVLDNFHTGQLVYHKMIMVTNNTNHFKRITQIKMEDWTF